MIVYLSNNSYLNDEPGITLYSKEELVERFHIGIPNQLTVICKLTGYHLEELEPLKYICNVRMGKRMYQGELSEPQKKILEKMGVKENEIR